MRAAYKGFTLHDYRTDVMAESTHFSQCEEGSGIIRVSSLVLKYSTKALSCNSLVTVSRWRSCVSEGQRRKLNETFRYLHLHPLLTVCGGSTKSPFSVIIYNLSSYGRSADYNHVLYHFPPDATLELQFKIRKSAEKYFLTLQISNIIQNMELQFTLMREVQTIAPAFTMGLCGLSWGSRK